MAFNADEDLLLMNNEGRIFILDVITESIIAENYVKLKNGQITEIDEAKFQNNTIVFRTRDYKFHFITNITPQTLR